MCPPARSSQVTFNKAGLDFTKGATAAGDELNSEMEIEILDSAKKKYGAGILDSAKYEQGFFLNSRRNFFSKCLFIRNVCLFGFSLRFGSYESLNVWFFGFGSYESLNVWFFGFSLRFGSYESLNVWLFGF